MKIRIRFLLLACALSAGFFATPVHAQSFPAKPIRLVVGIAPGGGLDASTRLVASKLTEVLGQQVLVENRPGAGGTIAATAVASAAPDGYTLLYGSTSLVIAPALYDKLNFDPVKSFAAVGGVGKEPLVLAVNPGVPARTPAELITLLKANPGKYSYGSPGVGSALHLAMEMFKKQAGLNVVHVPYKGAAGYVPDIVSGVLPMAIMSVTAALPQAKAGKLRVIALTSPIKLSFAPDWPSLADILPGFDMPSTQFVVAPAGTGGEVIARLAAALKTALSAEDARKAYAASGGELEFVPPAELAVRIREDVVKWGTIAREAGARL